MDERPNNNPEPADMVRHIKANPGHTSVMVDGELACVDCGWGSPRTVAQLSKSTQDRIAARKAAT